MFLGRWATMDGAPQTLEFHQGPDPRSRPGEHGPGVGNAEPLPFGITLREAIAIYAGGMRPDASLKLAQTGGSSGTDIPASLQDVPLDFGSMSRGVSLGSGALLIGDQTTCAVDLAKTLVNFFRHESCASPSAP